MAEEVLPAALRLTIESVQPLRASDIGRILDKLSRAFHRTGHPTGGAELRLTEVRIGSLVADITAVGASALAVGSAIVTVHDLRDILGAFMDRLARAVRILCGDEEGTIPAAERAAVEALVDPIVYDGARSASVVLIGSNVYVVNIDRTTIDAMDVAGQRRAKRARAKKPVRSSQRAGRSGLHVMPADPADASRLEDLLANHEVIATYARTKHGYLVSGNEPLTLEDMARLYDDLTRMGVACEITFDGGTG
jgi:hypothetical protein